MVREYINGWMEIFMTVNGKMILEMDRVFTSGQMEINIKENGSRIRETAKVI